MTGGDRPLLPPQARAYPRVDPVVVGLVTNSKRDQLLLGRSKKLRPGMFTCLSGFVEPCERVEDAFRREVFEEAGVEVSSVRVVDTQPWPVGRGGSCEIMLGCVAEAGSDVGSLSVDMEEMDDVRWCGLCLPLSRKSPCLPLATTTIDSP